MIHADFSADHNVLHSAESNASRHATRACVPSARSEPGNTFGCENSGEYFQAIGCADVVAGMESIADGRLL